MKKQKGFASIEMIAVFVLIVVLICAIGWVKNVIKLSDCDFEAPYKCEVWHGVGIIPPVGAVTGWMDFGK